MSVLIVRTFTRCCLFFVRCVSIAPRAAEFANSRIAARLAPNSGAWLRGAIPDLAIRTTCLLGFPGETEADFEELLAFVEETQFERLGVFKYSAEEGTAAARITADILEEEKERRWQEVMDLQCEISRKKNEALIGSIQRVMIDDVDLESQNATGRTQAHAPEVDGAVYVKICGSRQGSAQVLRGGPGSAQAAESCALHC